MRFRNGASDGEAQAVAAIARSGWVGAVKTVEQAGKRQLVDRAIIVFNAQNRTPAANQGNGDLTALIRIFNRVIQQN